VPGQEATEQAYSAQGPLPASVWLVRERVLGDVPGLVPIQFVLIHQEPHQLGNPIDGWVSLSWIATFSGKQSKLSFRR